jgi:undecaprenyl-diphosphatase
VVAVALLALVATGWRMVPSSSATSPPLGVTAAAVDSAQAPAEDPEARSAADSEMTPLKAAVLGVVEGITEYLPVSSTGHLLVTQRILGIGDDPATEDAANSYAIAIQFGAILAVLILYRQRVASVFAGMFGRNVEGRRLFVALVCATTPAVVIALLFERPIKDNLLGPWPVVAAWIVGGVVILVVSRRLRPDRPGFTLEQLGPGQALVIGVAQVIAMWPGTSRSLVTILAALALGARLATAVEFSFLLGLVTLSGATLYEGVTNGSTMIDAYGVLDPVIGLLFAFVAAVVAVKWMVAWLETRSLAVFGWERLAVAALTIGLLVTSTI